MALPFLQRTLARFRRASTPSGDPRLVTGPAKERQPPWIEVRVPADRISQAQTEAWCSRQTLREFRAVGRDAEGRTLWTHGATLEATPPAERPDWFLTLDAAEVSGTPELPSVPPSWLESVALVAAAEGLDAVALAPDVAATTAGLPDESELFASPWLHRTLWSASAFEEPSPGAVRPLRRHWTAKLLPLPLAVPDSPSPSPYVGRVSEIAIDDLSRTRPSSAPRNDPREPLLVLTPFLARGGAEHTLYETLLALRDRFDVTIVTLAPHRPELGDRREDFLAVTPRILCLGDLVHPAAMPGILRLLLDSTGARVVYNANSTTLFYDFAPALKQFDPNLRIVDHLYDHQVGYVDRYVDPALLDSVDACVAENHLVATRLVDDFGWPRERVPVVWPCGRAEDDLPDRSQHERIRQEVREELKIPEGTLLFFTAARMHEQKRPLDLVHLAHRVSDLPQIEFLVAGGGPLEDAFDIEVTRYPTARIRRVAFRSDVPRLILAADFGCLVSAYEGLPVFMMECFQLGRPFLGTDVGDLGRVLRQSGAGLIVDTPGDLDALEAAVRKLAAPGTLDQLVPRALAAAEQFSVKACAARYAQVLEGR